MGRPSLSLKWGGAVLEATRTRILPACLSFASPLRHNEAARRRQESCTEEMSVAGIKTVTVCSSE